MTTEKEIPKNITHNEFCIFWKFTRSYLRHPASVTGQPWFHPGFCLRQDSLSRMPFTFSDIHRAPIQTQSSGWPWFRSAQFLSLYRRRVWGWGRKLCSKQYRSYLTECSLGIMCRPSLTFGNSAAKSGVQNTNCQRTCIGSKIVKLSEITWHRRP